MDGRIFSCILCFLMAVSCVKEQPSPESSGEGLVNVSFSAGYEDDAKTTFNGKAILWTKGDRLGVYDGAGVRMFTVTSVSADGKTAEVSGMARPVDKYYAVYPYNEVFKVSGDGQWSVQLPTEQKALKGGFSDESNMSVAVSSDDGKGHKSFQMKNVCGYLRMELASGNNDIKEISVFSNGGEFIAGNLTVTYSGGTVTQSVKQGSCTVRLLPAEGQSVISPGVYFIPVLPSTISSGIRMTFLTAGGSMAIKDGKSKLTVTRNNVVNLGTLNPSAMTKYSGDEPDDKSADPSSIYFDYSKIAAAEHPRLLMRESDFTNLKSKIGTYPLLKTVNDVVLVWADKCLDTHQNMGIPAPDVTKGNMLQSYARPAMGALFSWSYAYRVTGDEKYLQAAKKLLRTVCSYPTWFPDSYLSTAELSFGVSVAYDWLYDSLDINEKIMAHTAVRNFEFSQYDSKNISKKRGNWNSVCNGGVIAGAIAFYNKEKAVCASILDKSIGSVKASVQSTYGPDGNYYEGYGYWELGTSFQVMINEMLQTVFGNDAGIENIPGWKETANYILFMNDHILPFNYSDGGRATIGVRTPLWWFAARYGRPDLLVNEYKLLLSGSYKNSSRFLTMMPCSISKYPEMDLTSPAYPASDVWSGNGEVPVAMVHTGWHYDARDHYVGIKGGLAHANHGHMDSGSFCYSSQGVRWSYDIGQGEYAQYENALAEAGVPGFGLTQTSYRWDIFIFNNYGHSTLTLTNFDGSFQKIHPSDHNVDGSASINKVYNTGSAKGVLLNMSPVFKGQAQSVYRQVCLMDDYYLQIQDKIKALSGTDADVHWRMITQADYTVEKNYIKLERNGKVLYIVAKVEPTDGGAAAGALGYFGEVALRPTGKWGWIHRDWDFQNRDGQYNAVGFTARVPAGREFRFTTVLTDIHPDSSEFTFGTEVPGFGDNPYIW